MAEALMIPLGLRMGEVLADDLAAEPFTERAHLRERLFLDGAYNRSQ
jgi:hypothetical protein